MDGSNGYPLEANYGGGRCLANPPDAWPLTRLVLAQGMQRMPVASTVNDSASLLKYKHPHIQHTRRIQNNVEGARTVMP